MGWKKLGGPALPLGGSIFYFFFEKTKMIRIASKLIRKLFKFVCPPLPDTCPVIFSMVSMEAWAESQACADPTAWNPIGASRNFHSSNHRFTLLLLLILLLSCIKLRIFLANNRTSSNWISVMVPTISEIEDTQEQFPLILLSFHSDKV